MSKLRLTVRLTEEQQVSLGKALGLDAGDKYELLQLNLSEEDLAKINTAGEGAITVYKTQADYDQTLNQPTRKVNEKLWFEVLDGKEVNVAQQARLSCCCLHIYS